MQATVRLVVTIQGRLVGGDDLRNLWVQWPAFDVGCHYLSLIIMTSQLRSRIGVSGEMTDRRLTYVAIVLLAMAVASAIVGPVQLGHAVSSSNLSVTSSGTVLAASRNSTLAIEISNVGKYMKELDVALTIPPPLVLFGDNHWIRSSFAPGDVIRANLTIFAPSSAAGAALQGSVVAVYKIVGETVPSSETHAISFLVRGWIDIKVYEIEISPDPALPGSEITISGNLLNRGVIAAMYTNVTIIADRSLMEGSVKPTYVGQVDPNAPAPFSVTATVDPAASEGTHQATVVVYYRDDLQLDHTVTIPVSFTVVAQLPMTQTARTGITDQLLSNQILFPVLAVIVVLLIVGIYLRRRRKTSET